MTMKTAEGVVSASGKLRVVHYKNCRVSTLDRFDGLGNFVKRHTGVEAVCQAEKMANAGLEVVRTDEHRKKGKV